MATLLMRSMSPLALSLRAFGDGTFLSVAQIVNDDFSMDSNNVGSEIPTIRAVYESAESEEERRRHEKKQARPCDRHPFLTVKAPIRCRRRALYAMCEFSMIFSVTVVQNHRKVASAKVT